MRSLLALALVIAIASGGCRARRANDYDRPLPEGATALVELPPEQWPAFRLSAAERPALLRAAEHSLAWLALPSAAKQYPKGGIAREEVVAGLRRFVELLQSGVGEEELRAVLRREFRVLRSVGWDGSGTVLFTGYYTPIFEGSRTRDERFRHPLYRKPADLEPASGPDVPARQRLPDGSTRPYPDRDAIDSSRMLAGTELVWLPDPVDAYIIQVQGSAKLRLPDGSRMEIGWAGDNGHPYISVAKALVDDGRIRSEDLNLSTFRAWFRAHPAEVDRYLSRNPRYVFFTETKGGPFGSLGKPVIADASIATDKRIFPPGALSYVATSSGGRVLEGFRLDQDTGGAIRAPGRCDLYMGEGLEAEARAGRQKDEGMLYYLVLRR